MGACGDVKEPKVDSIGTFTYFKNLYFRGEPIRILLAYKGIKYIADDITMEEFAAQKAVPRGIAEALALRAGDDAARAALRRWSLPADAID